MTERLHIYAVEKALSNTGLIIEYTSFHRRTSLFKVFHPRYNGVTKYPPRGGFCDLKQECGYTLASGNRKAERAPMHQHGSRAADTRKVCDGKLLLMEDSLWNPGFDFLFDSEHPIIQRLFSYVGLPQTPYIRNRD